MILIPAVRFAYSMSEKPKHHGQPLINFAVTVDAENRLSIPPPFTERFATAPGVNVIFVDSGKDNEFTIRVMPSSYSGALSGIFGTTEEAATYIARERASWNSLEKQTLDSQIVDNLAQQVLYAQLLHDLTLYFGSFRIARLWFRTPQPSLGALTPLDVIESGGINTVIGLVHMITSLAPN
jgi:hypothetical protein